MAKPVMTFRIVTDLRPVLEAMYTLADAHEDIAARCRTAARKLLEEMDNGGQSKDEDDT